MPWVAMGFSTLYLQLLGFSDLHSAILVAIFSFGCSLGSFGGGYIGMAAVHMFPALSCGMGGWGHPSVRSTPRWAF